MASGEHQIIQPETLSSVPTMQGPTIVGFHNLVIGMLRRRDFKWGEGHGVGQYVGLSEHFTSRFAPLAPKCDPTSCDMHVEVQTYTTSRTDQPGNGALVLECSLSSATTTEEFAEFKARCFANHQATREAFEDFVVSQAARANELQYEVDFAEAQAEYADRQLEDIL